MITRFLSFNQIAFLDEFVKSDLNNAFRLTGGTALSAFYLEHRFSEDLKYQGIYFNKSYCSLAIFVMPAKAGIQKPLILNNFYWIPAGVYPCEGRSRNDRTKFYYFNKL